MIKLLPFILIPILLIAGLGYWRFVAIKQSITSPTQTVDTQPIEVPKTIPNASVDDRVQNLENTISKLVTQVNTLKVQPQPSANTELNNIESSITDLKARVSALEKATPAPAQTASSQQSVVYIPLGSGGGPWANKDWYSTPEYQVLLDPANYPGYKGMYLEVTYKLSEQTGTGSVRLYNSTDNSVTSGQVDTTSSSFGLYTSSSFKLPTGSKNYALQVKSTDGKNLFIQIARIRVNF